MCDVRKQVIAQIVLSGILAVVYIGIACFGLNNSFQNDEFRYMQYADNLANGFYTTREECYLWNGPGYPITLAVFKIIGLEYKWARLLNSFFLLGGLFCVYRLLREYFSVSRSLCGGAIAGMFIPVWTVIPKLYTECQSYFLCCAFCYALLLAINRKKILFIFIAGFILAWLTLTKCFFGYVGLGMIIVCVLQKIVLKTFPMRVFFVFVIAQGICFPYLYYTYSLTGEYYCWTNCGGTVLYSMANPVKHEYGDWKAVFSTDGKERMKNHSSIIDRLEGMSYPEKDKLLKKEAVEMICKNPSAYLRNYVSNLGRLFFNYPYSYKQQRPETLVIMVPTAFLFFFSLLAIYIQWHNRHKVPIEIHYLMLTSFVYLAGSSLVYATARYVYTIAPALIVVCCYLIFRFVNISADRFAGSENE